MRTLLTLAATISFLATPPPARADEPDDRPTTLVARAKRSVVWLTAYKRGVPMRATGFVVARPGDGRKFIVTAGHVYQDGMTLTARLPGTGDPVPCEFVAMSPENDLMAVAPRFPIDAPALPLLVDGDPQPRVEDPVVVIGCPGGLDWEHYRGEINGEAITADRLTALFEAPSFNGRRTPRGTAMLLRHSTFSTPGMSGGPVLDGRGRVVGVQLGTLPKASNVSLGVHVKHLASLNLRATPKPFEGGPVLDSNIGHVLKVDPRADPAPTIRVAGQDINASCVHQGYVPPDPKLVMDLFIQDKERFGKVFGEERLGELLNRTKVAYLTNPALGFSMLVPKGYSYKVETLENPVGILVTLTSGDPTIAAPYNTIIVRAFRDANRLLEAKQKVENLQQDGKVSFPKDLSDDIYTRRGWQRGLIKGMVLGTSIMEFVSRTLNIGIRTNTIIIARPDQEIFSQKIAYSLQVNGVDWIRENFDSEDGPTAHAVHCGIKEDVLVLVHYQFRKQDRDDFLAGKEGGGNFRDRIFISSTVSVY